MAYSTRIARSDVVRLQHDDLIRIIAEAKMLTKDALATSRLLETAGDRVMLNHYEDIGDTEGVELVRASIEASESSFDERNRPRWTLWDAKDQGRESISAEAGEIVSRLRVPKPYRRVAVTIGTHSKKISIAIGDFGASIDVDSDDDAWALQTSLWAQQRIAEITPRYSWLATERARLMFVGLGVLAGASVAFVLRDMGATALALAAGLGIGVAGMGVAVSFMPGAVLAATPRRLSSQFLQQLAWTVAGAVLGVATSELWRVLTTQPVP